MLAPLVTKLYIPPPRLGLVPRQRLLERLNEGLRGKLTLISASAGFGKTTLVSSWISAMPQRKAVWLSLDEGDSEIARFLTYFIAALQKLEAKLGAGIMVALQSPQPPPTETLLTALLNELSAISGQFIFVLDDYHVVDSKPVDQALAFLIDHLPPQMHLVITTREDPALPLARLRARGQLTELRTADLRFTPAEAADFLNRVMELNLAEKDVAALETRTEGWIAGLQLAALSMQGQQDIASFIRSFTGSHRFVMDYLLEEVLHHQPAELQTFLLRTSILERLCGPLCEAVLNTLAGSGQAALEALERANLFLIPLDNEQRWYRYHHLFGDLLRQRLGLSLTPGEIAKLHIYASEWYENNGLVFDAFRHATAANDVERAERLIGIKAINLHFRSVAIPILDWLLSLPQAVLDARPQLWVRSATLALMAGQTAGVEERLQAAEKALQNAIPGDNRVRDLIGQMACARATLALTRYDPAEMIVQARRALEYLHPDNLSFLFTANWALASASLLQGDRAAAASACREGLSISQKSGDIFSTILVTTDMGQIQELENQLYQAAESYRHVLQLSGDHPQPNAEEAHLGLARIHYEWNDLEAAERYAQQSLELARQYDSVIDRFILSEVFLVRLKLAQGDGPGAEAMLALAEQSVRQPHFAHRAILVAAVRVLFLLQQDKLEAAAQLAQAHSLPLSQARVFIAQGDPSAALAILEPFRQQMEARGWADERLKAIILQSVALHLCGEKERAAQALGEALALAEPGGFIRIFIDEGTPMAELLSAVAAQGLRPDYVNRVLAAFDMTTKNQRQTTETSSSVELLSPRELDVLRLIAQGFSNQEIGERLFLALDTIKGHNRRIFEKLQVQRRTEAIARAHELGLL